MYGDQIDNLGSVLVIVVVLALFGWILIASSSSDSTQSEEEYYEQYSCPSGKNYDFGNGGGVLSLATNTMARSKRA